MRKTKEVLRLRFEVGLGQRQIARSCSIGLETVHEYLQRAEAAGDKNASVTGRQWVHRPNFPALFSRNRLPSPI